MADHETGREDGPDTADIARLRRLLHGAAPDVPTHPDRAGHARARAARIRRTRRTTYASVALAVLVAVGLPVGLGLAPGDRGPRTAAPGPSTGCPVTRPMSQDRVPGTLRGLGKDWYGADDLWVELSGLSGVSRGLKFGSFTLDDHGRMSDAKGPPSLSAERLDGSVSVEGDPLSPENFSYFTGAHGRPGYFWPTTIVLPGAGCWRLTETLGGTTIHFVIEISGTRADCEPDRCGFDAIRRAVKKPLHTPRLRADGKCQVSATRRFDGGAGFSGPFRALGKGPVYLAPAGGKHPGTLVMQRGSRHPGWLWTKPIWVFDSSYSGAVLLRGGRIDGNGQVEFDRYLGSADYHDGGDGLPRPSVLYPRNGLSGEPSGGLESFPGGLYVGRPGCYFVQADGVGFSERIVFRVVAPGSGR